MKHNQAIELASCLKEVRLEWENAFFPQTKDYLRLSKKRDSNPEGTEASNYCCTTTPSHILSPSANLIYLNMFPNVTVRNLMRNWNYECTGDNIAEGKKQ